MEKGDIEEGNQGGRRWVYSVWEVFDWVFDRLT